jgi:hypothetical protein
MYGIQVGQNLRKLFLQGKFLFAASIFKTFAMCPILPLGKTRPRRDC